MTRWGAAFGHPAEGILLTRSDYREIVLDVRLVFTGNCPDLNVTDSVVSREPRDLAKSTELTLKHELPADPKVRRGHEEGWPGCRGNLAWDLLVGAGAVYFGRTP